MRGFLSQPNKPRRGKGVVSSEPNISSISGFLAAYDCTLNGGKCDKDLSGTAATALDDPIAKVREYYGNTSRALANGNGSDRPLLKSGGVKFDGSNDYLMCAGFAGGTLSSVTVVARFSVDSAVANQGDGGRVFATTTSTASRPDWDYGWIIAAEYPANQSDLSKIIFYSGRQGLVGAPDLYASSVSFGTFVTMIAVFNNGAGGLYMDGSFTGQNTNGGTIDFYDIAMSAALGGGGTQSQGRVPMTMRRLAIFSGALGSTDRATCTTWVETVL